MKIASFLVGGEARFGVIRGDHVVEIGGLLRDYLGEGGKSSDDILHRLDQAAGRHHALESLQYLPPLPNPAKLICIASNYLEHILESGEKGVEDPSRVTPQLFLKPPTTTLRAHNQPLLLPKLTTAVDWEVELAVVIGRTARYVPESEVFDYILGYTVFNDVSERNLNIKAKGAREEREWDPFFDWFAGKIMDGFAPMGPVLVTSDEIPDPNNLDLGLKLNGELMQNSSTSAMMSNVQQIVSYISHVLTLEPGDVIATGTPHGVGFAQGVYLKDGDTMEAWVEGIGTLRTPVVAEKATSR